MKFGVVVFPGSNCDHDAWYAVVHNLGYAAEFIWHDDRGLGDADAVILPGGFSYGDYLRCGAIAKFSPVMSAVRQFAAAGGLVLGICNGFQVLVNFGLLPGFEPGRLSREVALIHNDCGSFRDQWVHLAANPRSPCVFTRGIERIELPVRHGEGKFHAEESVLRRLKDQGQIILQYASPDGMPARGGFPANPNGSVADIAGICDVTGRIAGLMPHPEAFNHWTNHPDWTHRRELCRRAGEEPPSEGDGIRFFRNAVDFFV